MSKDLPKIIAVVGPTASGKSDCAVNLALHFGGEVVSADSRQIYRGMDIGTAKITRQEMRDVPHYLIDIKDPQEKYSVQEFKKDAEKVIDEIHERDALPIICGGTGYYIQAVVDGIVPPRVSPNTKLRKRLAQKNTKELYKILEGKDPQRARIIERDNPRRLIRALEIIDAEGVVPEIKKNPQYEVLQIGIDRSDDELRGRINARAEQWITDGLIEEGERLHRSGVSYNRMREIGLEYRILADFFEKKILEREMIEQLKTKTWQYAKRQRTWFKRDTRIVWIDDCNEVHKLVEQFLNS